MYIIYIAQINAYIFVCIYIYIYIHIYIYHVYVYAAKLLQSCPTL